MKPFQRKRLEKLAEFLRTVKRSKFDIHHWLNVKDKASCDCTLTDINVCGTKACAGGWACTIPSFKKAGLRLLHGIVHYNEKVEYSALADFFGIKEIEARLLFYPQYENDKLVNNTAIRVSNNIKKLLKENYAILS